MLEGRLSQVVNHPVTQATAGTILGIGILQGAVRVKDWASDKLDERKQRQLTASKKPQKGKEKAA